MADGCQGGARVYCTQCGAEARSAARFCHACGSSLLTETSDRASRSDPSPAPKQQGDSLEELSTRLAASVSTWRCSRCRKLNRPGAVVCACGQSCESTKQEEA